ncbi:MAG: M1 family metallopeptidase [Chitinophagaceae bacterium]
MQHLLIKKIRIYSSFLLALICSKVDAQYFQQEVAYHISVKLLDETHTLDGNIEIKYTNRSPDTLQQIWLHIWPNAYKHDSSAFSDQLLQLRRTDFYFSKEEQRGYIAGLAFKINNQPTIYKQHPEWIDAIAVILPQPLIPGATINITTPFSVKIPHLFSRMGRVGNYYQITQWYPKPAVYDANGWHIMPYLENGEFYSEIGNYHVSITLPENYIIAANAISMNKNADNNDLTPLKQPNNIYYQKKIQALKLAKKKLPTSFIKLAPSSSKQLKTIQFSVDNVHDFAWFASKQWLVEYDTCYVANKQIPISLYYHPWEIDFWKSARNYAKKAISFYSNTIGTYPYHQLVLVSGNENEQGGGMEYPGLAVINEKTSQDNFEKVIAHEIAHNWFYGALANNERKYAWLDEGLTQYFESRYNQLYLPKKEPIPTFFQKKMPTNFDSLLLLSTIKIKQSQPINTPSTDFRGDNYYLMSYFAPAEVLKNIEKKMGVVAFDSAINYYYEQWKMKHPSPENLFQSFQKINPSLAADSLMNLVNTMANLKQKSLKLKPTFLFSLKNTSTYNYLQILPLMGYNVYNKVMPGILLHNYQLPVRNWQYAILPMYAFGTKNIQWYSNVKYNWYYPNQRITVGLQSNKQGIRNFQPENQENIQLEVRRFNPFVIWKLNNAKQPSLSTTIKWQGFFISEDQLNFSRQIIGNDTISKVSKLAVNNYVNQLEYKLENTRILYPYQLQIRLTNTNEIARLGITGKYFFNYNQPEKGIEARFFVGKLWYLGQKTLQKQFTNYRYQLTMSAPRGREDFTYSEYFVGRNNFEGIWSQQIFERDGFFKARTDLYSNQIGRTDNWLAALNISGNIPDKWNPLNILPIKLPLHFFIDIGTYAEAWNNNSNTSKFLYDAGIQCNLLGNVVQIYLPVFSSKPFRLYNQSVLGENRLFRTMSFQINLQNLQNQPIIKSLPL